ncbi:Ribosomal RNA small subunit methyltransferase G [Halomicronema hongdechloris C2206]|uniref:Ribosomal RNA small subunit methyltransferase G n=1 Tax=Halomicronema hongdechloris C2206 TaxID=1641165 RepID=A0A1Z3HVA4_9CYAN|nr:16S rRNA (guanine(527)-N(7))-methyltransferase RsmG [Halomicronema hongdechloris]ASC74202.1 Ribosomal RNA small subunit methyltransferase G [Halomicronema hongdechloris C2206]
MASISRLPEYSDRWRHSLHWQPDAYQQASFQALYEAILEGNRQLNLTRLTAADDFWEKHVWDSLSGVVPWLGQEPTVQELALAPGHRVIDIGTGAGFPGLPVAIACPTWPITLLDSTRKKIAWLAGVSQDLGLTNVTTITERAETLGHHPDHRQAYDLALVRAVGSVATCAEYALPLLAQGGVAVLYRGQWTVAEQEQLQTVATRLGGHLIQLRPWRTPLSHSVRHCVYLLKDRDTPHTYPRAVGLPAKFPLASPDS